MESVESVFARAFAQNASDIHFEPTSHEVRVRFRTDGVLRDTDPLPKNHQNSIINRLKILAHVDLSEKRLPQDGRIDVPMRDGSLIHLRFSSLPTIHGESVALRLMNRQRVLAMDELGFSNKAQSGLCSAIQAGNGLVLIVGPTGSGKTTTLYACVNLLNEQHRKIITVEDPIEYQLPDIMQVAVNPAVDMTFATALRSMLRQAPDVIMIGEIRDFETSQIALQASVTGHLVLSSLHANHACAAPARLMELGAAPYAIASGVRGILAQRLVRTICPRCARTYDAPQSELEMLDIQNISKLRRGAGCSSCHETGFQGRTGIFEWLELNAELCEAIQQKADVSDLQKIARNREMQTLWQDGVLKVLRGITTPQEMLGAVITQDE